jgi:D-glucosaminate-6-phosphate ammonia-lyase
VGKEEIGGLLTALELYETRDFQGEREQWNADMQCIAAAVRDLPGASASVVYPQANGRELPSAVIRVDAAVSGIDAHGVINALQEGDPPICVFEKFAGEGQIVVFPEALRPGEAAIIGRRLRDILSSHQGS